MRRKMKPVGEVQRKGECECRQAHWLTQRAGGSINTTSASGKKQQKTHTDFMPRKKTHMEHRSAIKASPANGRASTKASQSLMICGEMRQSWSFQSSFQ